MNRFTRKAALLLIGFFAAFNANAKDNWTWTGELRTSESGQEMYILNVGSQTFISNENKPVQTDILNEKVKPFKFWGSETSASISNDDKYRLKMDYGISWTINVQSGTGATTFNITKNENANTYKFSYTRSYQWFGTKYETRYFNVDGSKYTAASTQGDYNSWLLISPAQKEAYVAYRTAYDNANAYVDVALPTATKQRLTNALALTTSYKADNYDAVVAELNDVVTEIKSLQKKVNIADNYATICLPFNAVIPAGVVAYRLDNYDTDRATMELKKYGEEGDILPAGKGFVLYTDNADATAEYNFTFTTDKAADLETNLLDGTVEEIAQDAAKYYWVISKSATTGKVGFFILDDNVKIPANKAFFAVDRNSVNAAACSVFSLNGSATAITAATANKAATIVAIYNAEGKQQRALAKGLNIVKMSDGSVKKIMK